MRSYLFYDLETSGLSPCFDQVYQFAAIRTDAQLNILDQVEYAVQPTRDIIPSPIAMLTHQLPLELLLAGIPEHQAIANVHALFNQAGTISLGYNTLTFDDEFLRFNFYRHLLTPYTHQFKDGCGRMDILPMLVFYYLYKPDLLKWPMVEGKASLRLDALSKLNQLAEGQAHHAMVDVKATHALARILQQEEKVWHYLLGFFNKEEEQQRFHALTTTIIDKHETKLGLMIYCKWGPALHYQAPVLCLGEHRHYRNQLCWLRLDQEELLSADLEDIVEHAWVCNKKWAEPPFILPLQPRFIKDPEKLELAQEIIAMLAAQPELLEALQHHYLEYKHPVYPDTDIDAALYQISFMSREDEYLSRKLHAAPAAAKSKIKAEFVSPDLQVLAERYLGRFYYEHLTAREQAKFDAYLADIYYREDVQIFDYTHKDSQKKLLRMEALGQLQQEALPAGLKLEALTPVQAQRLRELEHYLRTLEV